MFGDPWAIGYDPNAHREQVRSCNTTLEVGRVYSEAERKGVCLPAGYRWSSTTHGLDASGTGVNRMLERVEQQRGGAFWA